MLHFFRFFHCNFFVWVGCFCTVLVIHCKEKMVTGTFAYNALHRKTLKECIKTQRKIVSHSDSRAMLLV